MLIYVKLVLTAVFWGGTFIAGRAIAGSVEPFSAAFLRFAIASILLVLLTLRTEGRLPALQRNQILPIILAGMSGVFLYNALFFKGLSLVTAGRASLIIAMNPVFITLAAALVFKDRLSWIKSMGIVLSVLGAAVVISKGDPRGLFIGGVGLGEVLILGCVFSWVAFSLLGKTLVKGLSPLASVSYSSAIGAACLFIPACAEGMIRDMAGYTLVDWASVFYLGVFGTVLGFVWYYEGIKAIGPTKAGQFIHFVPISALLLAFLILGEAITVSLLLGAVLVISGVTMTNSGLGRG